MVFCDIMMYNTIVVHAIAVLIRASGTRARIRK